MTGLVPSSNVRELQSERDGETLITAEVSFRNRPIRQAIWTEVGGKYSLDGICKATNQAFVMLVGRRACNMVPDSDSWRQDYHKTRVHVRAPCCKFMKRAIGYILVGDIVADRGLKQPSLWLKSRHIDVTWAVLTP